jgi:hypothetical protein
MMQGWGLECVLPSSEAVGASAIEPRVVDGLRHLYTAFQKSSIYAPGHPAAVGAIEQSRDVLAIAAEADESLLISVGRDRLLLNGDTLQDDTGALRSLAALLHDLDVSALRIDSGLLARELDGLIKTLGQARREGLQGSALSEMLERAAVRNLRIIPVEFELGADIGDDTDSEEDVWDSLESMLTTTSTEATKVAPEIIAEQVEQELARNEGTGVVELRERIQGVSREIDSIKTDKRGHVRNRLSKFVAALNPKLRQDLLRFDMYLGGDSLALMTEVGDVVPEHDLLEVLQNLDRVGARVPEQLLSLMSKLMRVARSRPTLKSGLKDTMDKWGVSANAMGDEGNLRAALEEVFCRRDRVECNPIPHQELLDTLAQYEFDAPTSLSLSRYRDPEDPEDVKRQTAEIVSRIVALPGAEEHRPGLFRYLSDSTERMLDAGLFESVRDAAMAARTYTMLPDVNEQTFRAAHSFLNDFKNDERVHRILGSACTIDPFPPAATKLLELCGDRAIDAALTALIQTETPSAIEALQTYLASRGAEVLRPALASRLPRGWSSWQRIFVVLRRMPDRDAGVLVRLLLNHAELEVRREALLLLHDVGGDRHLRLAELRRALTDDSARFARVAVRCLAEMGGEEPIEILGAYIDGSLGVTPVHDAGVRAAHSLLRLKDPGVTRLYRSAARMRRSFDPRRAALGSRIVELLATENTERSRQCSRQWKFSPGWLVSRFIRRPDASHMRGDE